MQVAPETKRPGTPVECGGPDATASMFRLSFTAPEDTDGDDLEDTKGGTGRRVKLVTDPTQDTFDRYGRLLAYVTTISGVNLQTAQLSAGWAKTYVFEKPFQRLTTFRRAERRARAAIAACGACAAATSTSPRDAVAAAVQLCVPPASWTSTWHEHTARAALSERVGGTGAAGAP